jgi:hypothetical protein
MVKETQGCKIRTRDHSLYPLFTPKPAEKTEVNMTYGSFNQRSVPENVAKLFPKTEEFGYELMKLRLQAICDTIQDRDSIYKQAKDAHLYVATLGPRKTENRNWFGVYW